MADRIQLERFYPHPIEKVWRAISTSEALGAWLMPNSFELKKGHLFEFRTRPQPGFDGIVRCQVLEFEEPVYLRFSWQGGPMKSPTQVAFELSPREGGTLLRLTHSGFEGLLNRYLIRFVLGSGWKNLLRKAIPQYLSQ